jgi:hypothetical protein
MLSAGLGVLRPHHDAIGEENHLRPTNVVQYLFAEYVGVALAGLGKGNDLVERLVLLVIVGLTLLLLLHGRLFCHH